ncbi:MAG: porphobilinogen synthase [Acidobacteria bacterium]|nr:porphobilinogen synthase [Acidobacteriota bacterium]NIM60198.1 porphobilinogen synthase [Acidobacteriota bacterium]NIO57867.1 porphobilinogen synthase [Acidobacteriota bacterium]NIQ28876.1 porphobilinogen synthase [Acidobacteriota bacterium]NIQ83334.1 porphobilinogen synthase [Acidobacteriota bacterium]
MFPTIRPRRLRRHATLRALVRETRLSPDSFVYPLFVRHGKGVRDEITSMPGIFHFSPDTLLEEVGAAREDGVRAVILFGLPEQKDAQGSEAWADDAAVQTAVRQIKAAYDDVLVLTDVCLCEYTDHGHCGVVEDGRVLNDPSLELLAGTAVSHARAGADLVAPSDMMDGRVGAIREALDSAGFGDIAILSYAAKYASAFYGPFREAADSAPQFGDRSTYQMDPANGDEALREVALDLDEGADMVMVKPALPYLDVIRRVKDHFEVPVAAYNVSGEFSMVAAAATNGWLDRERTVLETLTSIKRAGADVIVTYHAREAGRLLRG